MRRSNPSRRELYEKAGYRALLARIGANLRRLREAQQLTQDECAEKCGIEPPLLRRIESARTNVTALTLSRLCEGLSVDSAEFFVDTQPYPSRRPGRPPARPVPPASADVSVEEAAPNDSVAEGREPLDS